MSYNVIFFRLMKGSTLANVRLDVQHVPRTLLTEVITTVTENYVQWEGRNKRKIPIICVFRKIVPPLK